MPATYTEDKVHGPEVDFGIGWKVDVPNGWYVYDDPQHEIVHEGPFDTKDQAETVAGPGEFQGQYVGQETQTVNVRVTWVATNDDWTRGNVIAYSGSGGIIPPATRPEPRVLAWNIPLFVVEHILSKPYEKLNFTPANPAHDEDIGWATASLRGESVDWVATRLRRWEGCEVVHYSGKDYQGGVTKATKAWATEHGFRGAKGGWIYDNNGEPVVQGWMAFAGMLRRAERILCVKQEWRASEVIDMHRTPSLYTETWIVSQESAARRDF
jgi:hypothetical protein